MNSLPVLPILLPMATAILSILTRGNGQRAHALATVGAAAHLFAAFLLMAAVLRQGVVVAWIGSWPAPFGICLAVDYLSAVMVVITAVIHTAVTVYARRDIDSQQVSLGFYSFMQLLAGAVCGAFLTGDLFNLYVWFEVLLVASYAVMRLIFANSPLVVETVLEIS